MDSNNEVLAYAGVSIYAEFISNSIEGFELGKTGYYVIIDSNNLILSHPNEKLIATEATPMNYDIPNEFGQINYGNTDNLIIRRKYTKNGIKELQIYKLIESNNWVLIAVLPESELQEKSASLLIDVITIGIFTTILAIFVGTYISNKISIPIVAITKYINNAALSKLLISKTVTNSINSFKNTENQLSHIEQDINPVKSDDEIRNLAKSLRTLKEFLSSIINQFNYENERIVKTSKELSLTIDETSGRTAKFISDLSHDLKTSITLIKGYAKGIMSGTIDDTDIKNAFIEGIYTSAEDIERITCDILDSAYEAQYIPKLYTEKINAREFSSKLFETAKQFAIDSDRKFEGMNMSGEGVLHIDSIKINRVWNNLLSNAVKFSSKGCRIQVYILQENKNLTFRVIDEGIGIPTEDMDQIYNMFFRNQHNDTKGYGLGLFIAKSFIEAHGSALYFTSQVQKGSEFWFSLDIDENNQAS
ncbi:MAG: hypothetical protein KGZ33_01690 [Alkaliphilus sp.]|nr:hypothetical protein [Alkaliphilus sp.]